ncbi:beta-galactosidase GanA [Klebsiella sp. BIGb0407]|nr:beta-galactosidase GanA [Klebsiella sp. BIGb0407]
MLLAALRMLLTALIVRYAINGNYNHLDIFLLWHTENSYKNLIVTVSGNREWTDYSQTIRAPLQHSYEDIPLTNES